MTGQAGHTVRTAADYEKSLPVLEAYLTGYWLTDLANFAAFTYHALPGLNWCGFYLFDGEKLRLGPFVGRPACTEIRPGRGVCGTAFLKREALLVPDVDAFPGHIVCDNASRSELVLPMSIQSDCVGVLDLDSPALSRFTEHDRDGLALWLGCLMEKSHTWLERPWTRS